MKGNYIVLDCETGGLSPLKNPITQIALMGIDHKTGKELGRFETYIKPYNDFVLEPAAIKKTMVDINEIHRGAKYQDVVANIIALCKQVAGGKLGQWTAPVILGHNVSFDISFLEVLFYLSNKELKEAFACNNSIPYQKDTLQMARDFWPEESSMKLTDCCARAGIRLVDAHGAMNDVIATKNLYLWFRSRMSQNGAPVEDVAQGIGSANIVKSNHRKFFNI